MLELPDNVTPGAVALTDPTSPVALPIARVDVPVNVAPAAIALAEVTKLPTQETGAAEIGENPSITLPPSTL